METTTSNDEFAKEFRAVTLASERLLLCVCGCTTKDDARMLATALTKIATIKLQMSIEHQIGIACFGDARMIVLQEFTRSADALHDALDRMTEGEGAQDAGSMDGLLRDAGAHFSRSIETQSNDNAMYRLVFVYKHDPKSPRLGFQQSEASTAFLSNARFHLDVIYWHTGIPNDDAQRAFDQLCEYESANPFTKSYVLEVGESVERLFQALALMLSHPAHRANQIAVESLLESSFITAAR